jgi:hypothetical protein
MTSVEKCTNFGVALDALDALGVFDFVVRFAVGICQNIRGDEASSTGG